MKGADARIELAAEMRPSTSPPGPDDTPQKGEVDDLDMQRLAVTESVIALIVTISVSRYRKHANFGC